MVRIGKDYRFQGPGGEVSLPGLFEGRRQLIVYHSNFVPGFEGRPAAGCPAARCSPTRSGTLATCTPATRPSRWSPASVAAVERYRYRMGWAIPGTPPKAEDRHTERVKRKW